MMNETLHKWGTVKEAAKHGSLSVSKLWSLLNSGDVLAIRCGRRVVVSLTSLDQHFLSCPRVGAKSFTAADLGFAPNANTDTSRSMELDATLEDLSLTPGALEVHDG